MWGYCLLNQNIFKKIIIFKDGRHRKICNTEIQQVSKHRHFYSREHKAIQSQIKAQSKPLWLEVYRINAHQEAGKGPFPHPEYKICKLLIIKPEQENTHFPTLCSSQESKSIFDDDIFAFTLLPDIFT